MNWFKAFHSVDTHSEQPQASDSSPWWEACCSVSEVSDLCTSSKPPVYTKQKQTKNFKWTAEEDEILQRLVFQYKFDWEYIAQYYPGKSPSQISKRWINKLDPSIKKTRWTCEEDDIVLSLVCRLGHNWKEISKHLPGRPPDAIKSRFYSNLKKRYQERNECLDSEVDPDSFLCLDGVSTEPSAELESHSSSHRSPLNCPEDTNNTEVFGLASCKLSLTNDQKRALIRKLQKKVAKLQSAINSTSMQVKQLEEQMFPSESVL